MHQDRMRGRKLWDGAIGNNSATWRGTVWGLMWRTLCKQTVTAKLSTKLLSSDYPEPVNPSLRYLKGNISPDCPIPQPCHN